MSRGFEMKHSLVGQRESERNSKGDGCTMAWVGPIGQWLVVALVLLSVTAYLVMSYGIRNYLGFLRDAIQKVLGAIGVGL